MASKKHDPEFMELLRKYVKMDPKTSSLKFSNIYVSTHIDIGYKSSVVSIPQSHIVWFLTHNRWPQEGMQLDHIDSDPLNNRIDNLREVSHAENQRKRRGRIVSRAYGKGKYGHGMSIDRDKRDGRFYVSRTLSRGQHKISLKTIKIALGGFTTLAEAEVFVASYIEKLLKPDEPINFE
jgi:HNH endonuclease